MKIAYVRPDGYDHCHASRSARTDSRNACSPGDPRDTKECGKTSTEECLARYVCCIDDYCCEEPECIETGACETTCTTGQPDCCCEGKTCVPVSQGVTDGTCQATICSETLCDIGGVDTCCPDTGKTCDTSNNVCVLDCPVDEVICGAACCPSDNCLDGVRCCPEPICVIGGSGGTPTCCPDTKWYLCRRRWG